MVVAVALSCNFRFTSLRLVVHDFSFDVSPGDKGFQGPYLSLIYSGPLLHVALHRQYFVMLLFYSEYCQGWPFYLGVASFERRYS